MAEILDKPSVKVCKSQETFYFLDLVSVFYSFTALIFSSSIWTCSFPMTTPNVGIFPILKSHFDLLKHKLCFSDIFKNKIVYSSSSFIIFSGIMKSSI